MLISSQTAPANGVQPKKTGTIGVGVIGLGRSGTFFHCRPLAEDDRFEIVAVADCRPDVAGKVAAEYGCRHFEDYRSLLACPEIDLVVVAVPTNLHEDIALEAIAAGKDVLVEKPFARSSAEARRMFEAARRADVFIGAFHNRRFDPDVRALREILQSGVLGPVLKVSIHLHSYTRRKDWQTLRSLGGGALSNWGAHAMDWCFHLFGPNIKYVHGRLLQVLNPGDAEDSFTITLDADGTAIEIEYLNFVAKPLPKWHVAGRFGTAVSDGDSFLISHCNPALFRRIEADHGMASDGTYGVDEDLGWTDVNVPWGHWDNCPIFFEALHSHLTLGTQPPISPAEVVAELEILEKIRSGEVNRLPEIA